MSLWSSAKVRANPNNDILPGEVNVLLLLTIDANGRRKPREWIEDDSIGQLNVVHRGELPTTVPDPPRVGGVKVGQVGAENR